VHIVTTFAARPLEEQIAQWRGYVRRRQALHGADVDELEGHLRDQMTALTEAGLAGDEAFLVAVKRMGSLDALSREFALAHSERLWKQLVGAPEAAGESANAAPPTRSSSWALPSPRRWPSSCRRWWLPCSHPCSATVDSPPRAPRPRTAPTSRPKSRDGPRTRAARYVA
jgi:hypothetical protein